MLNSSSEIQWTVMVSWEAVQSSSRIDGGFGAEKENIKELVRKCLASTEEVGIFVIVLFFPVFGIKPMLDKHSTTEQHPQLWRKCLNKQTLTRIMWTEALY